MINATGRIKLHQISLSCMWSLTFFSK